MSDITITEEEILTTFSQLKEVMSYADNADGEYLASFSANMGFDFDALTRFSIRYVLDNMQYLPSIEIAQSDLSDFCAVICSFMARTFHMGLVLGRQHPIK